MLQDMKFQQGEKFKYDAYSIIIDKMKQCKLSAYENQFSTKLHRVSNQYDWE